MWAALAVAGAFALALIRRDAKKDARNEIAIDDHEAAAEIHDRGSRPFSDGELRRLDDAGYRD